APATRAVSSASTERRLGPTYEGPAPVLAPATPAAPDAPALALNDFQPRSMLHVTETDVPRAKYPVIDVHTHLTFASKHEAGGAMGEAIGVNASPEDVLPIMDRRNLRIMVNLTGNYGDGLKQAVQTFQTPHPDRFMVFTEPSWDHFGQSGY